MVCKVNFLGKVKTINKKEFLKYKLDKFVCPKFIDILFHPIYGDASIKLVPEGMLIEFNTIVSSTHTMSYIEYCGTLEIVEKRLVDQEDFPSGTMYEWYYKIKAKSNVPFKLYELNKLDGSIERMIIIPVPKKVFEEINKPEDTYWCWGPPLNREKTI
jgi:hypothetical protein